MLTFDTSGIELFVTENNPKILNALIKKLKAFYKDKLNIDPYKMAYGLIPPQTVSCPDAKQMYINGHFYYADKFAVLTNGLGIVRHIVFLDDEAFKASHPDLVVEKKTDSPDEDKSVGDASALVPVLNFHFSKALIPYNSRNESDLKKVGYNAYGYPTYLSKRFFPRYEILRCYQRKRTFRPYQMNLSENALQ
ncbi:hypothetical protein [Clostridium sp. AM34-9AC]|jgi:hypothetical protein|uniref:hypothetical protein n=1 Tax=Clostridium sp. AM34-9AC TaxID=2293030 RepID=UPI000E4D8EBD|nr:hypothetical protein [Clostridium sp. AM34-9AC]RHT21821.1 hypothetical protein DW835_01530 [Clostridium sp. AM34-9AC]